MQCSRKLLDYLVGNREQRRRRLTGLCGSPSQCSRRGQRLSENKNPREAGTE